MAWSDPRSRASWWIFSSSMVLHSASHLRASCIAIRTSGKPCAKVQPALPHVPLSPTTSCTNMSLHVARTCIKPSWWWGWLGASRSSDISNSLMVGVLVPSFELHSSSDRGGRYQSTCGPSGNAATCQHRVSLRPLADGTYLCLLLRALPHR